MKWLIAWLLELSESTSFPEVCIEAHHVQQRRRHESYLCAVLDSAWWILHHSNSSQA